MSEQSRIGGTVSQVVGAVVGLSGPYRVALVLVTLIAFVLPAVVIWSSSSEKYRVLMRGVRHKGDMQAITCELEKRGIICQLSEGGRTVKVPERKHSEALDHIQRERLMPRHGETEWKDLMGSSGSMGIMPEVQKMQRLRMLEMEVGRTIAMYDSVEFARVHITQPREGFFKGEASPVTASVFVDLTPGKRLAPDQVTTIKSLVSHAVEGLSPLNITLCDSSGVDYSTAASGVASAPVPVSASRELEMVRLAEAVMEGKVNAHLRRLFGPESFAVSVTVEVDATERPSEIALSPGRDSGRSWASSTGAYGPGQQRYQTVESRGRVRRVSVSVLVDSRPLPGGRVEPALKETLEADLKAAVGYRASRGDTLSILTAPFHRPGQVEKVATHGERPAVPAAAGALSLVASNFNSFWIGQVVVLVFVLALLVRHVGGPPRTQKQPETERLYPVRIDQVLAPRPPHLASTHSLESFASRRDLDLPAALAGVDERTLVLVMRTAAEPVREMLLANLTPDRARTLTNRIGTEGPVPLSQAEDARRRLEEYLVGTRRKGV